MRKQKTYKYTIELNAPMFPRHIADCITLQGDMRRMLLSVTDQQRDDHSYGATYHVGDEAETIIVVMEDAPLHSADMQCDDKDCPCHEEEWSNADDTFICPAVDLDRQASALLDEIYGQEF